MRRLSLLAFLILSPGLHTEPAIAQSTPATKPSQRKMPPGFVTKSLKMETGQEYKYAVFVPPQVEIAKDHQWPLIVFLHGSGESGEDGIRQTTVGLPQYISTRPTKFPFIVLMPQAHATWFRGQEALMVWKMLAVTRQEFQVDPDRIYLTGLSMGGFGTWELAMAQPDVFAAMVPVCGAAPKDYLGNVSQIPIWAFHGAQDRNVPVAGSREAIKELKRLGGVYPKYTEYPDVGHECWDRAYSDPELWKWLRAQRRKAPRVIDYRLPAGIARIWWLVVKSDEKIKGDAHIRASIDDKGLITVETEGVESWGLLSDTEPLKPGMDITVTWNGAAMYRGTFKGSLTFKPMTEQEKAEAAKKGAPTAANGKK
ncbi:MAG: PHB depolymerase family esterase [Planctomycetota bacterium]